MSITGKTTPFQTLKRLDVPQQKSAGVGYQNVAFAHQATVGQTGIDLTSLNSPSGFNNPSPTALLNCNLGFFQNNLILMSSTKGVLMPTISFTTVGSQRVNFVGFTADQDEIFYGLIMATPRTGLMAVDARSIGVTGSLIVGATDFNVGQLFQVGFNSTAQVGQVVVYRNGLQQFRCIGNNAANEGDYTELDLGNGYGQVIRFKLAVAAPDADSIMVASNGLIAEKPDASQLAEVERVAGQLDRIIPYVAQSAGVDESDLRQYNPTNTDLKAFGDTVLAQSQELADHESRIDSLENNLFQTKSGSFNTTQTDISTVRFSNLVIGKIYRLTMNVDSQLSGSNNCYMSVNHTGASFDGRIIGQQAAGLTVTTLNNDNHFQIIFTATATTVTFNTNCTNTSNVVSVILMLEKLNNYVVTTGF